MRFIFFIILLFSLQAKTTVEKANAEKANQATAELSAKTFVPTASMDGKIANGVSTPAAAPTVAQNNLKVIATLQNMQNRLKSKEDDELPKFDPNRELHPSDKDDSIPNLRQILQSLGYLEKATDSPFFDIELETAVKAFQASHCLDADGVIGDDTKARLNWSYATRLKMIADSIEKLKPLVFTKRTAIVNIPTYTMHVFEGHNLKMSMKAIVGQPKRPTPTMTSYINAVEINPSWVVPHTILFEDKIPEIIKNVRYLKKNNLQIFDHDDNEVDPKDVDWEEADEHDFLYTLKQKPGAKNALGRIRFNLVNNQEIYLHDTPLHNLFKKCSRSLSSGCIRLEKPVKLAAWLLGEEPDAIKEAIDTDDTTTKKLGKNMTVHITYLQVWVEANGQVLWGADPYHLNPQPQT